MKKHSFLIIASLSLFLFSSCINEEGEGGTAAVDGYIYKVFHPDGEYNFKTDTFPAAKTDVYIKYGNEKPYGDKMDAGPDGYFKFKYLTKGIYTIFAYNKYPDGHEEAIEQQITVSSGKTATIKNIYIHEGKMFGKSYIKGKLLANYYDNGTLLEKGVPAVDSRVYIRKKNASVPFNDVKAGADGVFMFEKLAVGEYVIYAMSESADRVIYVEKEIEVNITKAGEIVEIAQPITIKCRS